MNSLPAIILSEREAPTARRPARGGGAEGFDSEIRDARTRASNAPERAEAALGESAGEPAPGEGAEGGEATALDGRAMAGLLEALVLARPAAASEPAEGQRTAEVELAAALAPGAEAPEGADPETAPRVRLKLVHQETHFEPTTRDAVLVDGGSAEPAGEKTTRDLSLAQLLDARPKPAAHEAAAAPRHPASENAAVAALAMRGAEGGPASLIARAGLATGEPQEGVQPKEREATDPRATVEGETAPLGRRERQGERSAVREALFTVSGERQPQREVGVEPVRGPQAPGNPVPNPTGQALSTQIADRIVDAFAGTSTLQRPDAPNLETHLRLRAGGSVLKTLTIQLQPEHLGTLNVSMRLKEGQLMLEMAASRAETALLLAQDRPALKALLEKAGFSLDEAAIVVVARDAAPSASAPARETGTGGGEQGRAGGETGAGGDRGAQRESLPERRAPAPEAARRSEPAERGRAGTVFL